MTEIADPDLVQLIEDGKLARAIRQIEAEGLVVNNLFQLVGPPTPVWQANLRKPQLGSTELKVWGFAHGPSAGVALQLALARAKSEESQKVKRAGSVGLADGPQEISAEDLGL